MIDAIVERLPRGMQQFVNEIVLNKYPEPERPFSPEVTTVITALENPQFHWRTVNGIARETGLLPDEIQGVLSLEDFQHIFVHSRKTRDREGRDLYSTRAHYNQTRGLLNRFLDASAGFIR